MKSQKPPKQYASHDRSSYFDDTHPIDIINGLKIFSGNEEMLIMMLEKSFDMSIYKNLKSIKQDFETENLYEVMLRVDNMRYEMNYI